MEPARRRSISSASWLLVWLTACGPSGEGGPGGSAVVEVALPTGDPAQDRPAILRALDRVEPGGTVQFAPGLYVVGEVVSVTTDRVTLLGHPDGTIYRGCDPDDYQGMQERFEAALSEGRQEESVSIVRSCGSMELIGTGVTVRGFTFEHSRLGVCTNSCTDFASPRDGGGYVIEGNVFRNSGNGVRPDQNSAEASFIRGNVFVNTFHAVSGGGIGTHVVDNDISAPSPDSAPERIVSFAIGFSGGGEGVFDDSPCRDNVIAGNRIDGHPDGIKLLANPGGSCVQNAIRDNTISATRVPRTAVDPRFVDVSDERDSTAVGLPIQLYGWSDGSREAGRVDDNTIEGNVILGSEGLGIALTLASGNRILGNEFSDIRPRVPFPGNTIVYDPAAWGDANGAAIWISAGSDENEIHGNAFTNVAGPVVALAGDGNRVTVDAGQLVRDRGEANEVVPPGG